MQPMIIPHENLSAEALAGLVEEYVSRDGTERGEVADKSKAVIQLLERGELVLVYDPDSESCNLIAPDQLSAAPPDTPSLD